MPTITGSFPVKASGESAVSGAAWTQPAQIEGASSVAVGTANTNTASAALTSPAQNVDSIEQVTFDLTAAGVPAGSVITSVTYTVRAATASVTTTNAQFQCAAWSGTAETAGALRTYSATTYQDYSETIGGLSIAVASFAIRIHAKRTSVTSTQQLFDSVVITSITFRQPVSNTAGGVVDEGKGVAQVAVDHVEEAARAVNASAAGVADVPSGVVSGLPFPSAAVVDNFNRTAENPLSQGGNWANGGLLTATSLKTNGTAATRQQVPPTFSRDGSHYNAVVIPAGSPCEVSVLAGFSGADGEIDVGVMNVANNRGYMISAVASTGFSGINLWRTNAGATVTIATDPSVLPATGDRLTLQIDGSWVRAWITRAGVSFMALAVEDATYRDSWVGVVEVVAQNGLPTVDDFAIAASLTVTGRGLPIDAAGGVAQASAAALDEVQPISAQPALSLDEVQLVQAQADAQVDEAAAGASAVSQAAALPLDVAQAVQSAPVGAADEVQSVQASAVSQEESAAGVSSQAAAVADQAAGVQASSPGSVDEARNVSTVQAGTADESQAVASAPISQADALAGVAAIAAVALETQAAVTAALALLLDSVASVQQAGAAQVDEVGLAAVSASGLVQLEALAGVTVASAAVIETVARAVASTTALSPLEASQAVQSAALAAVLDVQAGASATAGALLDIQQAVQSALAVALEGPQAVAALGQAQLETVSIAVVQALGVSPLDVSAAVRASAVGLVDATVGVQTLVLLGLNENGQVQSVAALVVDTTPGYTRISGPWGGAFARNTEPVASIALIRAGAALFDVRPAATVNEVRAVSGLARAGRPDTTPERD